MRFAVKSLALALLLADSARATITMDHGQFHVHNPTPGVKDYKTGGPLTIHVLAHSHDDVGWLKTVDQYFDGSRRDIQWTNVEVEISSIVDALLENPARKFTQVEMKFFTMWWDKQTDERKEQVRKLVANGQLEMINGGWSMHDEACPVYDDMINNHMIGMEFLEREFGVKPRIGWQVDPFGHSNTNVRLFADMGFDAWFFARLDYQDKNKRMNDKEMEFVWRPYPDSLGNSTQIFSHALYNHYDAPDGMGFDIRQDAFWINDGPDSNAEKKAAQLMNDIDTRAQHYLTDDILTVFGGDFQYINSEWNYRSMDNMIEYMNKHHSDKYHFVYSTPSNYIDAIKKYEVEWPIKTDDMFPYSDHGDAYWTGYFSSRANGKAYTRRASHYTHAQNKLAAEVCFAQDATDSAVDDVMEAKHTMLDVMGIAQHHDAITGTERQDVANDYAERISVGMEETAKVYSDLIEDKVNLMSGLESDGWTQCSQTNSTYLDCPVANWNMTEGAQMTVAIQNPSSLAYSTAKIAVPHGHFKVQSFNSTSLQFEEATAEVLCHEDYVQTNVTTAVESCFLHANVITTPHDVSLLQLTYDSSADLKVHTEELNLGATLKNNYYTLEFIGFSSESSLQFELCNGSSDKHIVNISLGYWPSLFKYTSLDQGQNSGNYIFRPIANLYEAFGYSNYTMNSTWSNGTHFQQMDFYFENADESARDEAAMKVILHVSLDDDVPMVKVDVDLGSLPTVYVDGYEMVVQFAVEGFKNNGTFYTDSNGLEMQERHLNYRPTWDLSENYKDSFENITANYYPINSAISIQDEERMFTVVNDRSQGGSSLHEGQIELMQNRRIPAEDSRGMGEVLDEKDEYGNGIRVPATYYFQATTKDSGRMPVQRFLQNKIDEPAQYFFSFSAKAGEQTPVPSTLSKDLSDAGLMSKVKLNYFPLGPNKVLLRLANLADQYDEEWLLGDMYRVFDVNIDVEAVAAALAKEANRRSQVTGFQFSIEELALAANMSMEEFKARKINWKTVDFTPKGKERHNSEPKANEIQLKPQEIKVFAVTLESSTNGFLN